MIRFPWSVGRLIAERQAERDMNMVTRCDTRRIGAGAARLYQSGRVILGWTEPFSLYSRLRYGFSRWPGRAGPWRFHERWHSIRDGILPRLVSTECCRTRESRWWPVLVVHRRRSDRRHRQAGGLQNPGRPGTNKHSCNPDRARAASRCARANTSGTRRRTPTDVICPYGQLRQMQVEPGLHVVVQMAADSGVTQPDRVGRLTVCSPPITSINTGGCRMPPCSAARPS